MFKNYFQYVFIISITMPISSKQTGIEDTNPYNHNVGYNNDIQSHVLFLIWQDLKDLLSHTKKSLNS